MKRYIALVRGINISGKNKLSMADLKKEMVELDFQDVVTYLNTGNVIFTSEIDDNELLATTINLMIKDRFALEIPVHIVLQNDLKELLIDAPDWWGNEDKDIYDNLILMISLTYEELYHEIGDPNEEYENVQPHKNGVFWSFSRKNYQKTNWWSKTTNAKIKNNLTIRTANTIKKIVDM